MDEIAKEIEAAAERVLEELRPLRVNRNATDSYCDSHLNSQYRFNVWYACEYLQWVDSDHEQNIKEPSFKYNDGEVNCNIIDSVNEVLLVRIEKDYTFGYAFEWLGQYHNRKPHLIEYDCIANPEKVRLFLKVENGESISDIDCMKADVFNNKSIDSLLKICSINRIEPLREELIRKWKDAKRNCNLRYGLIEHLNSIMPEKDNASWPDNAIKKKTIEDKLEIYFKSLFRGMGNGNENKIPVLVDDLCRKWNGKEFAQIALMIYNSGNMNAKKPTDFSNWLVTLCDILDRKVIMYKINKIEDIPDNIKSIFYYL